MIVYLLYSNYHKPSSAPPIPEATKQCHAPQKSAIIEINPNKPEKQRSWFENFLLWLFKDQIAQKQNSSQVCTANQETNGNHN